MCLVIHFREQTRKHCQFSFTTMSLITLNTEKSTFLAMYIDTNCLMVPIELIHNTKVTL